MKVGFITIGQSPRVDVIPEIKPYLRNAKIVECGALDDLTPEEIQKLAPIDGNYVLVTRLRDGSQVKLGRNKIVEKLQTCIDRLEKEVDAIGILCTGEFPELKSEKLLVEPSLLLLKTVESLRVSKLGVLIPDPDQVDLTRKKWQGAVNEVIISSISPYTGNENELKIAAQGMRNCDLIVLDCIGYTLTAKKIVKEATGKPVVLPRTLMARILGELLEG